jgi:2-O-(6-phospho-alpha-D-mannosyl)-D-glycerate hydrolase
MTSPDPTGEAAGRISEALPVGPSTVIHLVPHTHWDREWYQPFQVFRMRLVELIDLLLERMAADERLRFTLDGQAATIDDYLEVRPEAEPLLRRLIAERRLAIGPWQILLDEFLVSGETIVRNLALGWARSEALGGAMAVGYLPDMFGHIAQMPQILRRAGIGQAVVWRGVPAAITQHRFDWRAPDGSVVDTEYLIGGYGNGAYLFDVPDRFGAKVAEYCRQYADFYGRQSLLAMYGTDHAVPSARLADLVDAVNAGDGAAHVRMETLADYMGSRATSAAAVQGWTGELRSGARANMLMNVVSARVDVKAAAARAERLLERYAEPLTALHGAAWPERLLELAWRRMVDNSAHDSICGCSHDAVVGQVLGRYAEAEQIGRGIVEGTVRQIGTRVGEGRTAIVNPSPFEREDLVELEISRPPDWSAIVLRVGEETIATQEVGQAPSTLSRIRLRGRDIAEFFRRRRHGRELFGRLMNGVRIDGPDDEGLQRLIVLVHDVPEPPELDVEELLGEVDRAVAADPDALWEIVVRTPDRRSVVARVAAPALGWVGVEAADGAGVEAALPRFVVRATDRGLDNGLVAIEIREDGTVHTSGGGSVLEGVGRMVDGGDFGDSYNYGPPAVDTLVDTPNTVQHRVVEYGPVRGVLEVERSYAWPVGVEPDGSARSGTTVPTTVTIRYEVRADEPFVRVSGDFENRSRDHRVRFHLPLPVPVDRSFAEGQFAVVERALTVEGGHGEMPLPTFPAHGWVHVPGVSMLLDQVTEYEVVDGRDLALTIQRSFGLISRNANPYREDPAGPEVPVPNGQLLGDRTFRFAILPHAGDWLAAGTVEMAERYRHPFVHARGTGPGDVDGRAGPAGDGLRVDGPSVVLSALRHRGEWLEIRVVNEGDAPTTATLHLPGVEAAQEVDLLGRVGEDLTIAAGVVALQLGAWEVRTVQVRAIP